MNPPDYIKNMPVVIIERDYKGEFERFALTGVEFFLKYGNEYADMPEPNDTYQSYTLKPMVHVCYRLTTINSAEWNRFFTDMQYGLSESDIANRVKAHIRLDLMDNMIPFLPSYRNAI